MKLHFLLMLTMVCTTTSGQGVVGVYRDHFGYSLELKEDSTFRFDWRFDLIHNWAVGKWTACGRRISLEFVSVYDTLSKLNMTDSLVLSIDAASNKITEEVFAETALLTGGQYRDRFRVDELCQRGRRLYIVDKNGRINKSRHGGIRQQRKCLWGYKKWPTWYAKIKV